MKLLSADIAQEMANLHIRLGAFEEAVCFMRYMTDDQTINCSSEFIQYLEVRE